MRYRKMMVACPYCGARLGELDDGQEFKICVFCEAVLDEEASEEEIERLRAGAKIIREDFLEDVTASVSNLWSGASDSIPFAE